MTKYLFSKLDKIFCPRLNNFHFISIRIFTAIKLNTRYDFFFICFSLEWLKFHCYKISDCVFCITAVLHRSLLFK